MASMLRSNVTAAILAMTACAGTSAPAGGPRWVSGERHETGERTRPMAVPFQLAEAGVNGTALVYGFAALAGRFGASAFSNLAVVLQLRRGETLIECTTRFVVGDRRPDAAPDPGSWEPAFEDAWVTDLDARCEAQGEPIERVEPRFESRTDVGTRRVLPDEMPMETRDEIVFTERCTLQPARRQVHRYQHYIAARFTPPDLAALGRLADAPLVALPARCRTIPETRPPIQRIEGELHFPR